MSSHVPLDRGSPDPPGASPRRRSGWARVALLGLTLACEPAARAPAPPTPTPTAQARTAQAPTAQVPAAQVQTAQARTARARTAAAEPSRAIPADSPRPAPSPREVHAFLAHLDEASIVTARGIQPLSRRVPRAWQPWTEDDRLWFLPPRNVTVRFPELALGPGSVLHVGFGRMPGSAEALEPGVGLQFEAWLVIDGVPQLVFDRRLEAGSLAPGEIRSEQLALPVVEPVRAQFDFRMRCDGDLDAVQPVWRGLRLVREPADRRELVEVSMPRGLLFDASRVASSGDPERAVRAHPTLDPGGAVPDERGSLLRMRVPGVVAYDVALPLDGVLAFRLAESAGRAHGTRDVQVAVRLDGEPAFERRLGGSPSPLTAEQHVPLPARGGASVRVELSASWVDASGEPHGDAHGDTRGDEHVLWIEPSIADVRRVPRQHSDAGPNLLLVVVDTLRADHVSALGYGRPTTPTLDALVRQGVLFEQATAHSSWTVPSMGTLLTGRSPYAHGLYDLVHWRLDPRVPTLAQVFGAAGWSTVCVMANPLLNGHNGATRGFEHLDRVPFSTAAQVNRVFLDWIDGHPGERVFALLHYLDPHEPYAAPGDALLRFTPPLLAGHLDEHASQVFSERLRPALRELGPEAGARAALGGVERESLARLEELYDGEIAYWDARLGELLAALEARGMLGNTIVVVTSDHGEEFADHGMLGHGRSLHRELLHVPLVVSGPALPPARRADLVGLIDLAPTLLGLVGVQPAPWLEPAFEGRDLFGPDRSERMLFAQTSHGERVLDGDPVEFQAVLSQEGKAIRVRGERSLVLYDRCADPGERSPRDAQHNDQWRFLNMLLDDWERSSPASGGAEDGRRDLEAVQALREMGYLR